MLNATPNAPKNINASFKPILGIVFAMLGIWSSLVNVRIPVSQKDGPIEKHKLAGDNKSFWRTVYTSDGINDADYQDTFYWTRKHAKIQLT